MKIIISSTINIALRFAIAGLFIIVLVSVIAYARGYRFNFLKGTVTSTGIISVNSTPRGAKVYVNDKLSGATDLNLTLPYGEYDVEIHKEGYSSWKKHISLKGEIVMSLNAVLFSKNPSLTPLTNIGVTSAYAIGTTEKTLIISDTGKIEQDGIYIFEPSGNPVSLFPPIKLLLLKSKLPEYVNLKTAKFTYSPKYRQAIANFEYTDKANTTIAYLISLENENKELFEVTNSAKDIVAKWQEEKNLEIAKLIETLPKAIQPIASDSFQILSLSPDDKKLMYIAKNNTEIPTVIKPSLIGANQSPQTRNIQKNSIYIYDKKEDKNFLLPYAVEKNKTNEIDYEAIKSSILWYPSSDYVVYKVDTNITVVQYDGTNKEVVYAGPFDPSYFNISPDWKLIVIINLNQQKNKFGDLYSVGIR